MFLFLLFALRKLASLEAGILVFIVESLADHAATPPYQARFAPGRGRCFPLRVNALPCRSGGRITLVTCRGGLRAVSGRYPDAASSVPYGSIDLAKYCCWQQFEVMRQS
jgi:hypothetical protein